MTIELTDKPGSPRIISRPEHIITRANINEAALKVLYRLRAAGFQAFLVGGGVRDLLLGREPKDFDVATDAHPEAVNELFRNSRLIGRRFKLVHVRFGREIIEVATFRGTHEEENTEQGRIEDGMILRDNVYGSLEEDAWRRDFTINSLYYDISDFSVVDYTGGLDDLENGLLRIIGDARQRYQEDPVRMLRAVRFAAKLGFRIHADSELPLTELGERLEAVPPARLFDEILKLFMTGYALETFELLRHYDLFRYLFEMTDDALSRQEHGFPHMLVSRGLFNTDERVSAGKPVTPAFLFAILLWEPVREQALALQAEGVSEIQSLQIASESVIAAQVQRVALPKRFSLQTREIWVMQARLKRRNGKRAERLFEQTRFRAAYDFLLLRAESGEDELKPLADWWTQYQELNTDSRASLAQQAPTSPAEPATKKRRRRRRKPSQGNAG
ncbi:MAG: polynucleotide adenylyltransferase PcnB [Gammaproteobacteria bacterium]|nr:polynucleotide adenylyltransferase PcnB [Gammaproteobacteria bacterium]